VVISSAKSGWRLITGGVSQRLVLGPVLLNIFVNDLDSGAECTLGRFSDDAELGGMADRAEGRAAIQKDFNRLEK